jgi:hypothetical protein
LGLGRHLAGCHERLIELSFYPLTGREDELVRIPGYRVRRFFLERDGARGRIHFLDGTPTDAIFEIGRDDMRVLHWIGLPFLREGGRQWFDLAARAVDQVAENSTASAWISPRSSVPGPRSHRRRETQGMFGS